MGSKKSKVASSTANVINTVEIVDDIQDVYKTMKLIVGLLLVLVIRNVVKIYKRSVQRRRDQHHGFGRLNYARNFESSCYN